MGKRESEATEDRPEAHTSIAINRAHYPLPLLLALILLLLILALVSAGQLVHWKFDLLTSAAPIADIPFPPRILALATQILASCTLLWLAALLYRKINHYVRLETDRLARLEDEQPEHPQAYDRFSFPIKLLLFLTVALLAAGLVPQSLLIIGGGTQDVQPALLTACIAVLFVLPIAVALYLALEIWLRKKLCHITGQPFSTPKQNVKLETADIEAGMRKIQGTDEKAQVVMHEKPGQTQIIGQDFIDDGPSLASDSEDDADRKAYLSSAPVIVSNTPAYVRPPPTTTTDANHATDKARTYAKKRVNFAANVHPPVSKRRPRRRSTVDTLTDSDSSDSNTASSSDDSDDDDSRRRSRKSDRRQRPTQSKRRPAPAPTTTRRKVQPYLVRPPPTAYTRS